jgi:hypothetical protein
MRLFHQVVEQLPQHPPLSVRNFRIAVWTDQRVCAGVRVPKVMLISHTLDLKLRFVKGYRYSAQRLRIFIRVRQTGWGGT